MVAKKTTANGSVQVTFDLPVAVDAREVHLCGDFNDWSRTATRMKRRKDGHFSVTLRLVPGCSYRYRFLLDGDRWENDWSADAYPTNPYGGCDSLVRL